MKKFLAIILASLMFLGLAMPAFADMDGPIFKDYEVRIVNKNGAEMFRENYYETDSSDYGTSVMEEIGVTIPYGEIVIITGEYEFEGELYLNVEYNEEWGYLKQEDTDVEVDEISYKEGVKLETPRKVAIVGKGFYLYKGPSKNYDKVGAEVAVGTILTYEYGLIDNDYNPWAYFTYNGVSGWGEVYQYGAQYNCASIVDENCGYRGDLYVASTGVKLTDMPESTVYGNDDIKYVSKEIPVGTRLTFDFYYNDAKSIFVYVEYGGAKGWLEADCGYNGFTYDKTAIGTSSAVYVWQDEGLPVYSEIGNTSSKVLAKLEKGSLVKADYRCFRIEEDKTKELDEYGDYPSIERSWYGVEVNGKLGWINIVIEQDNENDVGTNWCALQRVTKNKDVALYKEPEDGSDVVIEIPAGSDILEVGSKYDDSGIDWVLVDYSGNIGWIEFGDMVDKFYDEYTFEEYFSGKLTSEYLEAARTGKPLPTEPVTEETTQPSTVTEPETETVSAETEENKNLSSSQIIIFCVAGALVLAATAAVTIVLINKKKRESIG